MRLAIFLLVFSTSNVFAFTYADKMNVTFGTRTRNIFTPTQAERKMSVAIICKKTSLNIDDFKAHFFISPTGESQLHFTTDASGNGYSDDENAFKTDIDFSNGQMCMNKLAKIRDNSSKITIQVTLDSNQKVTEVQYCNIETGNCSTDSEAIGL